ncbi:hypothetical protein CFR73_13045 [Novacetimonas maltaceti]|nr:hypothetical protein CFR73_13045 [Novacetimonas maltaceti]
MRAQCLGRGIGRATSDVRAHDCAQGGFVQGDPSRPRCRIGDAAVFGVPAIMNSREEIRK